MDCFDLENLEKSILSYKKNLTCKLESVVLTSKEIKNSSDLLSIVLTYSPKNEKRHFGIRILNT